MKYAVLIAACALMSGCGDTDEDTGEDTAGRPVKSLPLFLTKRDTWQRKQKQVV